jgi:hypothetical protein
MAMNYIDAFMEVYNAGAAFVLIFLIGQILYMMRKVNKDILKARLFLNDAVMQRTWTYISIAGASFAVNSLVKMAVRFTTQGQFLGNFYILELSQFIFLIAFVLAVYNWYVFIASFVTGKST